MRVSHRYVARAAAVVVLLNLAAACQGGSGPASPNHGPHPLTAAQAQQLAVVRFGNYRAGVLRGSITARGPQPLDAQVLVDLRRHRGLAVDVGGTTPGLIAWDMSRVWVSTAPVDDPFHGRLPAAASWSGARLNQQNAVDLFLRLVLELGSDRPENPQLLRQSSARFLRTERVGGRALQVFSGPRAPGASSGAARTTYWLDGEGDLVRFEAAVWGSAPSVLTLDRDSARLRMPHVVAQLAGAGNGGRR